jgi:RNA polymerase sigma factor (sigma-70 family)
LFPGYKRNIRKRTAGYHNYTDEKLVAEYFSNHDAGIIGELFKRYTHLVFGICLKYLKNEDMSKDAVMEIFENLIEKLKTHEVSNFKNWLYSVSKNHCLMLLRTETANIKMKERIYQSFIEESVELQDEMHLVFKDEQLHLTDKFEKAFRKLKKEQVNCIRLMYLENKSYKEITEITGYSIKKVKSYIQNGKRNLKNYLIDLNGKAKQK